jgi:hypothetical protein
MPSLIVELQMLVLEHILGRVQNSDDLKHVWHFEDLA